MSDLRSNRGALGLVRSPAPAGAPWRSLGTHGSGATAQSPTPEALGWTWKPYVAPPTSVSAKGATGDSEPSSGRTLGREEPHGAPRGRGPRRRAGQWGRGARGGGAEAGARRIPGANFRRGRAGAAWPGLQVREPFNTVRGLRLPLDLWL